MESKPLAIEAIVVRDLADHAVHTERYLNSLSDTAWAELRAKATLSKHSGTPLLRCGDCGGPVYAREYITQRRHCYHVGAEIKDCRWSSANARNFRSVDADKFRGNQEGERHKKLKGIIRAILALDTEANKAGIFVERYTKGAEGRYCFPDVFAASWQGGAAAFEIQLATTQLPNITRREEFYKNNKIRLCWIIGAEEEAHLELRAFKDIHLRNDGQILGVDGDVLEAARRAGAPQFRLYRKLPGPVSERLAPVWKNRVVCAEEIDWGDLGDRPKSAHGTYDKHFNMRVEHNDELSNARKRFYNALSACDEIAAGAIWNTVADKVGGQGWKDLGEPHDTVCAFGVLATVRRGEITVKTKIAIGELPHLINSMLLEPTNRRRWTSAFNLIAKTAKPSLLTVPSIQQKRARNLAEHVPNASADQAAGQVFNVFFPEGAFQRLRE